MPDDQVAFPVPGHRPVFDLGGPLADHDHARDPAPCAHGCGVGRRMARPVRRQRSQLPAQRAAALHIQRLVDRLVRHPHLRMVRELGFQPGADLLRGPVLPQPGRHLVPQHRAGHQLGGPRQARRSCAIRSAAEARYPTETRLRASSRLTVEGARPRWRAIWRTPSPTAAPAAISSRPASDRNRPDGGTGRRGRTPPRSWIHRHAAASLTPAASAALITGTPALRAAHITSRTSAGHGRLPPTPHSAPSPHHLGLLQPPHESAHMEPAVIMDRGRGSRPGLPDFP